MYKKYSKCNAYTSHDACDYSVVSNQVVYVLNTYITFNFSLLLRTLNVQYVMKHLRLGLTS